MAGRGDTTGAIVLLQGIVHRDWRATEARWWLGRLHFAQHEPGRHLSRHRRLAEEQFRYAARLEPDSAKYWLALAEVLRSEDNALTRGQVAGLVRRAHAAALTTGQTHVVAETEFRAGRIEFERWEHYANRWISSHPASRIQDVVLQSDWRFTEQFFSELSRPVAEAGEDMAITAERHFRTATTVEPSHLAAAAHLVVLLGAQHRWEEALDHARRATRAAPDSGLSWALAGLALTRLQRWREAARAFARGFQLMNAHDLEPYTNLKGLLGARAADSLAAMDPGARTRAESTYWQLLQPLMLDDVNQPQVEYYARVTFARARWSDPHLGQDGARSDRGGIYVRYGPPDIEAVFDRSTIVWVYRRSRLRFMFHLTPGFANARLADFSHEAYQELASTMPARFDNLPAVRSLDTIAVQVAQFRGHDEKTDVAVFGWLPFHRLVGGVDLAQIPMQTATILRTDDVELVRVRRDEVLNTETVMAGEHRTWRIAMPPGRFLLRVEARLPGLERAARHTDLLGVRDFSHAGLAISDLLLARRLAPRDSVPSRWTDFFIEPSAGRVDPGQPVSLLWEVYNATPDANGRVRWRVELIVTVTAVERRDLLTRIVGGIGDATGASAVGSDEIRISWEREATAGPGAAVPDYVTLDFGDSPPAAYAITVVLTDMVSGQFVQQRQSLIRSRVAAERGPVRR